MVSRFDNEEQSPALVRWAERLNAYMGGQGEMIEPLRLRNAGELPFPEFDNPMVGYLIDRALELAAEGDITRAVAWVAAHAWFEATIEERARIIRQLTT